MFRVILPRKPMTMVASAVRRRSGGQATTEYILLVGLIVIPIVAAYNRLNGALKDLLSSIVKLMYGPGL